VWLVNEIHRRVTEGTNASNLAYLVLLASLVLAPLVGALVRVPSIAALVVLGIALGPHGLGLFATREIALGALGSAGLHYAMFVAGLELDPRGLARHGRTAIRFALASFAIPALFVIAGARLLHVGVAAAILLGAGWGSHTMVSLPLLRRQGLAHHPAVATVVAATPATSILVVATLAGVSVAARLVDVVELVLGLLAVIGWSLVALPRISRWFFARVGSDPAQRFVFALAAMSFGALLAEAAGVPGILGAFLAGLGLSRTIPAGSLLMERVVFPGTALIVPVFLVWVGTRIDPTVLASPRALGYVAVFTAVVLGGKLLAAVVIGTRAGFDRHAIGVMWGLSTAQVAPTLATVAIGARLGVLDAFTIHVVLAVVLVTLVASPMIVSRCSHALTAPVEREPLGHLVFVPICDAASRPLLGLAGRLAAPDLGMVVAGSFATEAKGADETARLRVLRDDAEAWLGTLGLEGRALLRVSRSIAAGVLQTVRGEAATLLVAEWRPELRDAVIDAPVPVVVTCGVEAVFDRVLVVAPRASPDLDLAREVTRRLGGPVTAVGDAGDVRSADPIGWVAEHAHEHDLVVLPGLEALDAALARAPAAARHAVVAVAVRTSS
jgi:Kef-type K+ transport system membrane component KefB